jgi:hypothetical protein
MLYVIILFWFLFDGTSIFVYMSGLARGLIAAQKKKLSNIKTFQILWISLKSDAIHGILYGQHYYTNLEDRPLLDVYHFMLKYPQLRHISRGRLFGPQPGDELWHSDEGPTEQLFRFYIGQGSQKCYIR